MRPRGDELALRLAAQSPPSLSPAPPAPAHWPAPVASVLCRCLALRMRLAAGPVSCVYPHPDSLHRPAANRDRTAALPDRLPGQDDRHRPLSTACARAADVRSTVRAGPRA